MIYAIHSWRSFRRAQRGLSLIELIIFIVIISVGVLGILSVLNTTAKSSADPMIRKQVLAVAEGMLEEVLSKDFGNPAGGFTPATPGSPRQADRPSFDNVDDYNMTGAWNWTGVRSLIDTSTDIPGLESYTVTITVAGAALNGIPAADSKAITVTVRGGNETVSLLGYRTNYE